jgi:hypothetical protein
MDQEARGELKVKTEYGYITISQRSLSDGGESAIDLTDEETTWMIERLQRAISDLDKEQGAEGDRRA